MPNNTYFNTLILCVWLQVIDKVKLIHQSEGHIKVKVKYLHPFKFYVAHTFCKLVVCIRLNEFLFVNYESMSTKYWLSCLGTIMKEHTLNTPPQKKQPPNQVKCFQKKGCKISTMALQNYLWQIRSKAKQFYKNMPGCFSLITRSVPLLTKRIVILS